MTDLAKQRVQDPVLTKLAQGYHNLTLISEALFPVAEMEKEGGKIPTFGRLAFRLQTTKRELRGASNRLTPEDIGSMSVVLEENDIEYPIDIREINETSGVYPLRQYALGVTQDVIALGREKACAELARDEANYDATNKVVLSGTSKFSDPTSDPIAVIKAGIRAIKRNTGRKPNVCAISGDVWEVLSEHPKVLEKIKYVQTAILDADDFAKLIKIDKVVVGEAVYETDGTLTDIWTKDIVLAYVPTGSEKRKHTIFEPSYGYTVRRKNGLYVDTYSENGGKIEIIRTTDIHAPCLVGKAAGYLIKDCI
ncbi:major capsid protein [Phocoenobacter skyensis]|uniref:Major capsid protein n=1 Tax=Phocoenobacter skyensis TaxID=97481 RepID=A0ABT9JN45_9PAST|nr:major capsid protein [Pasteurella skyensis]MDP8080241.1 major capsid protein [Pasteurella skyensis]MDP8086220.1 major capsid protein [Pasteurella skyensis]